MNDEVRAAVLARAKGRCEFDLKPLNAGEVDHMWGRAKAAESVENCWLLCVDHHREKTDNLPSRVAWLEAFSDHCRRHGYGVEGLKAEAKLFYARAKADLWRGL